jgi:subtilisin family serine protease
MSKLKKFLGVIVIGTVITVSAFAQDAPAKAAIGLDASPLVKGIIWTDSDADNSMFALAPGFEYLVHPHYTVGAAADLYFGEASKIDIFYFGLAAHGRWYPQSSGLDKFFIDVGLGFNVFSYDGETDSKKGGFTGLTMSLKAGYKLMFTTKFFIEPSMAFVYAKMPSSVEVPTPLGWQPGLSIGGTF